MEIFTIAGDRKQQPSYKCIPNKIPSESEKRLAKARS